jgi:hypothetical protein
MPNSAGWKSLPALTLCRAVGLGVEEALRYEGVKVLGVDLSEDMVRRASERNSAAVDKVPVAIIDSLSNSNSHSTTNTSAAAAATPPPPPPPPPPTTTTTTTLTRTQGLTLTLMAIWDHCPSKIAAVVRGEWSP